MRLAVETSRMGTCFRRKVGCILVNESNVALATGVNGVPPKWEHCSESIAHRCRGAESPSGINLDECVANHAEVNALLHCPDVTQIATVYTTTSPCVSCVKALLCTGAYRIVFLEEYPHVESKELWTRHGAFTNNRVRPYTMHRTWERLVDDKTIVLGSSGLR